MGLWEWLAEGENSKAKTLKSTKTHNQLPKKVKVNVNVKVGLSKDVKNKWSEAYCAPVVEKLKGGALYKVYYEQINSGEYSRKVAYLKIIFSNKNEIVISPLSELKKEYVKKMIECKVVVPIAKYEFLDKSRLPKHLNLFRMENNFFDLPEEMVNKIAKSRKLKIINSRHFESVNKQK